MIVRFKNIKSVEIPTDLVISIIKLLLNEGDWESALNLYFVNRNMHRRFHTDYLMSGFTFPLRFAEHSKPIAVRFSSLKYTLLANQRVNRSKNTDQARFFKKHGISSTDPAALSQHNLRLLRAARQETSLQLDNEKHQWQIGGVLFAAVITSVFIYQIYQHASEYGFDYTAMRWCMLLSFLVSPASSAFNTLIDIMTQGINTAAHKKHDEIADTILQFQGSRGKRIGANHLDLQDRFAPTKVDTWQDNDVPVIIPANKPRPAPMRFFSKANKMQVAGAHLTDRKMAEFMRKMVR